MFQQQKGKRFLETIPVIHPPAKFLHSDKTSIGIGKHCIALVASLVLGLALGACSATEVAEPTPTETQAPTATTVPTPAPTPTPTPTPEPVWSWYWNINALREIVLDEDGMVWAVGTGPLIRWDPDQGSYKEFAKPQGMPSNSPLDLLQGTDGALWATYRDGQIWRYFQGKWEAFERSESVQANAVVAMAAGPDGMVWFCTSTGIARHDSSGWIGLEADESYPKRFCRSLAVDKDGNPWMLGDYGISTFQDGEWRIFDVFNDPSGEPHDMQFRLGGTVFADVQGRVWFDL